MKTLYKAINKNQGLVLSPERQFFSDSDNITLLNAGLLFGSKEAATNTASQIVSPKFKVVAVDLN